MTRFYFFLSFVGKLLFSSPWAPSLTRGRRTRNHTLLSPLRLLGSLSVASYDSQGLRWKYSYPTPHEANSYLRVHFEPHRKHHVLMGLNVLWFCMTWRGLSKNKSSLTFSYVGWHCLTWDYWVPFPSPLTTRRDYGGNILTRLRTGHTTEHSSTYHFICFYTICWLY
jgi:hypothetical protein